MFCKVTRVLQVSTWLKWEPLSPRWCRQKVGLLHPEDVLLLQGSFVLPVSVRLLQSAFSATNKPESTATMCQYVNIWAAKNYYFYLSICILLFVLAIILQVAQFLMSSSHCSSLPPVLTSRSIDYDMRQRKVQNLNTKNDLNTCQMSLIRPFHGN